MSTNPLYKLMKGLNKDEEEQIVNPYDDGTIWTLPEPTTTTDYTNPLVYGGSSSSNPLFDLIKQQGTADPNARDLLQAPRNQMNYYTNQLQSLGVEPVKPQTERSTVGDVMTRLTAVPSTLENTIAGTADNLLEDLDKGIEYAKDGDWWKAIQTGLLDNIPKSVWAGLKSGGYTLGSLIDPKLRDKAVDYGKMLENTEDGNLKAVGDFVETPGYLVGRILGQDHETALKTGNLVGDIGLSLLSGNVTDLDNVGKAIKYLNKADELENISKVVNNAEEAMNLARKSMKYDDYVKSLKNMADSMGKEIDPFEANKMYQNYLETTAQKLMKDTNKALGGIGDFDGLKLENGKVLLSPEKLKKISENKVQKVLLETGLTLYSPLNLLTNHHGINKISDKLGDTKIGQKVTGTIEDTFAFGKNNEWAKTARNAYKEGRYDEVLLDMSMKGETALNKKIRNIKEMYALKVSKEMRDKIDDVSAEKVTHAMEGKQDKVKEYVEETIVNDEYVDAIIGRINEVFHKGLGDMFNGKETLNVAELGELQKLYDDSVNLVKSFSASTVKYKEVLEEIGLPNLDPKYFTMSLKNGVDDVAKALEKEGIENSMEVATKLNVATNNILETIENASPDLKGRFKDFKMFDFSEGLSARGDGAAYDIVGDNTAKINKVQGEIDNLTKTQQQWKDIVEKEQDPNKLETAIWNWEETTKQLKDKQAELSELNKKVDKNDILNKYTDEEIDKAKPIQEEAPKIPGETMKRYEEELMEVNKQLETTPYGVAREHLEEQREWLLKQINEKEGMPIVKGTERPLEKEHFIPTKGEVTSKESNVKAGRLSERRELLKEKIKRQGIKASDEEIEHIDSLLNPEEMKQYEKVLFYKEQFNNTIKRMKNQPLTEEQGILSAQAVREINKWLEDTGYESTGDIKQILELLIEHRKAGEATPYLNFAKGAEKAGKFKRLNLAKAGKKNMKKADKKIVNDIRSDIMEMNGDVAKIKNFQDKIEKAFKKIDQPGQMMSIEGFNNMIYRAFEKEGIPLSPIQKQMVKNADVEGLKRIISSKYREKTDDFAKYLTQYEAEIYYDMLSMDKLPPVSEAVKEANKKSNKMFKESVEQDENLRAIYDETMDVEGQKQALRDKDLVEPYMNEERPEYAGGVTDEDRMVDNYLDQKWIKNDQEMEQLQREYDWDNEHWSEIQAREASDRALEKELKEAEVYVPSTKGLSKEMKKEIDEGLDEVQGRRMKEDYEAEGIKVPKEFEGTIEKKSSEVLDEKIANSKVFEPKGADEVPMTKYQGEDELPFGQKPSDEWLTKQPLVGQEEMDLDNLPETPLTKISKEPKTFVHNEVVERNEFFKQFPTLEAYTTHKYSGQKYYYSDFDKAPKYVIADDGTKLWKPYENNPGMELEEWSNNMAHNAIRSKKRPELKPEDMKNPEYVKQVKEAQRLYDNYQERLKSVEIEYSPSSAQYNKDYNRYQNNPLTKPLLEQQKKLREEQYNMNRYNMEPKTDLSILEGQEEMDLDKAGLLPETPLTKMQREPKTFIHNELANGSEMTYILHGGLDPSKYKWDLDGNLMKKVPARKNKAGEIVPEHWIPAKKPEKIAKEVKPKQIKGQTRMNLAKAGTLDTPQANKFVPKEVPKKIEPKTEVPKKIEPKREKMQISLSNNKADGKFLGYEFEVNGSRVIIDENTPIEDIKKIFTKEMIADNYVYTPKLKPDGRTFYKNKANTVFMKLKNLSPNQAITFRLHEDAHAIQNKLNKIMLGDNEAKEFLGKLDKEELTSVARLVEVLELSGQPTKEALVTAKQLTPYITSLKKHGARNITIMKETDAIMASIVLNPNPVVADMAKEIFGDDITYNYIRARMKASKDNIPWDSDFNPSKVGDELQAKISAMEKGYQIAGEDKEKFNAIKGLLDSISDSSEAQGNAEVLLSKLEQYKDIDPQGFEEAVKGLESHIKVYSEVEKIIDLDMTKDLSEDELEVYSRVKGYFTQFGLEEGIIKPGEEGLFNNYVFHSLNPKFKMDKEAQKIARERWGEGFSEVFNVNALERKYKGKISELNESFRNTLEEAGKEPINLFETNIIDIYTKRAFANAKTMYDKKFQDGFIEKFGMENVTNWGDKVNTSENVWELMQQYVPEDLRDDEEAFLNLRKIVMEDYEKSNKTLYQFMKEDTPKYTGKTINDFQMKDYSQEAFAKRAVIRRFGLSSEYNTLEYDPVFFDAEKFKLNIASEETQMDMYKEKLRAIEAMKEKGLSDKSWTDHRAKAKAEGKVFVDNAMVRMEAEELFQQQVHRGLLKECPENMDIDEFKRVKRQEIRRDLRKQYQSSKTHHYAFSDVEVNNQGAYKDMMYELSHSDDYIMVEFMGNKKYTKANTIGEGVNPDEIDGMNGEDLSNYRVVEKSQIRKRTLTNQDSTTYMFRKEHWDNYKKEVARQKKQETNNFIRAYDKISNMFKTQALASGRFITNTAFGNIFESYMTSGVNLLNPKMIKMYIDYASGKDIDIGGYNALEIKHTMDLFGNESEAANLLRKDSTYKQMKNIIDAPETPLSKMWNGKSKNINPLHDDFFLYKGVETATSEFEKMSRFINVATHLQNGDDMATAIHKMNEALFDYSDLTDFEENWMKRIMPFYTFMRKNIPLQLKNIADNPAKYARLYNGYEKADDAYNSEQDQKLRPEYLDNALPIGNNKFLNLPNPVNDLDKLMNPYEMVQSVNPMIKTPIELLTNTKLYSGSKVSQYNDTGEKVQYAAESLLPLAGQIRNVVEKGQKGDFTPLVNMLGVPYKTFDKDKAEQQTMYQYVEQLQNQYYKLLEDNPGLKEALEEQKNKKNKKNSTSPLNKMLR